MISVTDDVLQRTVVELSEFVRKRELSPVELVEGYLRRIERLDGELRAYITVCADAALREARVAEHEIAGGAYRGPLHGIPVGLKDQFLTRGVRTTAGSRLRADYDPTADADATVVRRIREAGAIVIGKHNMAEFALGGTRIHPFGQPRNPWDKKRIPGHSSSGSGVAVAAALCAAAIGEDTGGSGRIPGAACGVVALRPTFGRVSRHGAIPVSWSMDSASPMTRSVEDCALLLQAIAGHDPNDSMSSERPVPEYRVDIRNGVQGLRVGVIKELAPTATTDDDYRGAFEKTSARLSELGAAIEEVSVPLIAFAAPFFVAICDTDAAQVHFDSLRQHPEMYDSATRARLMSASLVSAGVYIRAQRARAGLRSQMLHALHSYDVLLSPMANAAPPLIDDEIRVFGSVDDVVRRQFGARSFTTAYSLAGLPAVSIPVGFTSRGLPIGIQIGGRAFDERIVLRVAYALEQTRDWRVPSF